MAEKFSLKEVLDLSCKESMVDVDIDGDRHTSFNLSNGEILVIESIPSNYPNLELIVFSTLDDYIDAISKVDWVCIGIDSSCEGKNVSDIKSILREAIPYEQQ